MSAEAFIHQRPGRLHGMPASRHRGVTPFRKLHESDDTSLLLLRMSRRDDQERPRKRDRFHRGV